MPKQIYKCINCNCEFERWPSRVRNKDRVTCGKVCREVIRKIYATGSNNPNYKTGVHCHPSKCMCGGKKDYRALQCNRCSGNIIKYFAKGTSKRNAILWRYIRTYSLLDYENCSLCGQDRTWNGKELVLQLDHIDGDTTNNSLTNLRVLCPNCHTQTPTYCSKNKGRYR